MIEVQSGVPIPAKKGGRPPRYPWRDLAVGDSFFIPAALRPVVASASRNNARRNGGRFRVLTMVENGIKGVRVWRIA